MHRVSGPYRGYFIGAYTRHTKAGFVGYGKVFISRPEKAWRAEGVTGELVSSAYPNELQALVAAEHKVRMEIDQLPPSWDPFTAPGLLDSP